MEPMTQALTKVMTWAAQKGYEKFTLARLERFLSQAEQGGVTVDELTDTEHRFAHFVSMVRALESCSNNEMADYLAALMIGGAQSGNADKKPDIFHAVLNGLGSMTKTEVNILFKMHRLELFEDAQPGGYKEDKVTQLVSECMSDLGIDEALLAAILNGMIRTGFVTPPPSGYGGHVTRNSNLLTQSARDLFFYIDYSRLSRPGVPGPL
ncbi:hypothetical protein GCM10010082_05990 [Kushneria pakistanensis]|uniref:Uncharacterized protein n=1 Tax=Kushneria pakistanensis TaxID=1508770 RepID=A0ABQ3FBT1_9GAMM|nr:hypothetical protein [Kushneria pakistanensis]GHC17561.1 hypothetical protein GCM10010082_05990 [Kushneria pakistanensis]